MILKVVDEAAKKCGVSLLPPSLAEENLQKLCVEKCNTTFMYTPRVTNLTTGHKALSEEVMVLFLRKKLYKSLRPKTQTMG